MCKLITYYEVSQLTRSYRLYLVSFAVTWVHPSLLLSRIFSHSQKGKKRCPIGSSRSDAIYFSCFKTLRLFFEGVNSNIKIYTMHPFCFCIRFCSNLEIYRISILLLFHPTSRTNRNTWTLNDQQNLYFQFRGLSIDAKPLTLSFWLSLVSDAIRRKLSSIKNDDWNGFKKINDCLFD